MNPTETNVPLSRSWKDIPQQVKPRAMSSGGRRRMRFGLAKTVGAIALLGLLAWGGVSLAVVLQQGPKRVPGQAEAAPIRDIVLATDGAINREWVVRTLGLPKNATLISLDLYQLRARLLASGQVLSASLTRNFPATLTVSLTERLPVARLMAQLGTEPPHLLLAARDGVVFEGIGYDESTTAALPWLEGVQLTRKDGVLQPIPGMATVADLLSKGRIEAEHLYRTWQVVSLARLATDGEIEVKTAEVPRIIFGTRESFFPQLARLDLLLDTVRAQSAAPFKEINLAIGATVPVAFDGLTAAAPATAGKSSSAKSSSPRSTNVQFKTKL
ncbi:MAG: FtsQ-type POTRA domain-containing protein [Verrucomicrobia bacterium]|nr:FtsQ-type POTRA domain-containing protein [Verrucomicrobiota bacterium]